MNLWMDGQKINWWVYELLGGFIDRWTYGWMGKRLIDGCINYYVDSLIDELMDRWVKD